MDKIFEITAKEVTIQVKDERTGWKQFFQCFLFCQRNGKTQRSDGQGCGS